MTTTQASDNGTRPRCQPSTLGAVLGRYGLVVVIGRIGALKFANFEAHQIQPLVANSPFMGWRYDFLPVYTFSALLGVVELALLLLLAIKPLPQTLHPRKSARHSAFHIDGELSIHHSGVGEPAGGGFPAISLTGEFLLKDIPLLGLSFWTVADAIRAVERQTTVPAE